MNKISLNQPGDRTVFKVPANYFADFEVALNARIDAFESDKYRLADEQVVSLPKKGIQVFMNQYRPIMYMASMFVLLLFSIGLVMHYTSGEASTLKAETSKEQTLPTAEDYLISNVGTYGISEYYVESGVTE
jgi:hypothetical protein